MKTKLFTFVIIYIFCIVQVTNAQSTDSQKLDINTELKNIEIIKIESNCDLQQVTITYKVITDGKVKLSIKDMKGKEIAILSNSKKKQGQYFTVWRCNRKSECVYFCQLSFAEKYETGQVFAMIE